MRYLNTIRAIASKKQYTNKYYRNYLDYLDQYKSNAKIFGLISEITHLEKNLWKNFQKNDFAYAVERYFSQLICKYFFSDFRFYRITIQYLLQKGNYIFPISKKWLATFDIQQIKVKEKISRILYGLVIFILILRAFLRLLENIILKKISLNRENSINIYFDDLPKMAFSQNLRKEKSYNFMNWVIEQDLKIDQKKINILHNSLKDFVPNDDNSNITYFPSPIRTLSFTRRIKILGQFIIFIFKERNVGWHKIMVSLDQSFVWFSINYGKLNLENYRFIFNASRSILRPIWTYAIDSQHVKFYFYSIYSEPEFRNNEDYFDGLWTLSTWENIHFVDDYQQLEFYNRYSFEIKYQKNNSVPWWEDQEELLDLSSEYVVLFDTLPRYQWEVPTVFMEYGFDSNDLDLAKRFLVDSLSFAEKNGYILFHKFKRGTLNEGKKEYLEFLTQIEAQHKETYKLLNSNLSPFKLIKNAKFVISKPFSTIGLIAKELDVRNAYFDPINAFYGKKFKLARGIQIINKL